MLAESHERIFNAKLLSQAMSKKSKKEKNSANYLNIRLCNRMGIFLFDDLSHYFVENRATPTQHSCFVLSLAINLKSTFKISFCNGNFNWKRYLLVFAFLANIHDIRDRIDFGATSTWISDQNHISGVSLQVLSPVSTVSGLPSTFFTAKKLRLRRQVVFLI